MLSRLEEKSSNVKSGETDKNALEKIQKQMENQAAQYKQLIHFSNIVSGYLQVESTDTSTGKKETSQNTATAFLELEDNAYLPSGRDLAADKKASPVSDEEKEQVKRLIEETKKHIKAPSEEDKQDGSATMEVDQLNKLLKYRVENDQENDPNKQSD